VGSNPIDLALEHQNKNAKRWIKSIGNRRISDSEVIKITLISPLLTELMEHDDAIIGRSTPNRFLKKAGTDDEVKKVVNLLQEAKVFENQERFRKIRSISK